MKTLQQIFISITLFTTISLYSMQPTSTSTLNSFISCQNIKCGICLEDIQAPEVSLACHHNEFHKNCLNKWRKKSNPKAYLSTCPCCKRRLIFLPEQSQIVPKNIEFKGQIQPLWNYVIQGLLDEHHPFTAISIFRHQENTLLFKGFLSVLDDRDLQDIAHNNCVYVSYQALVATHQERNLGKGALILGTRDESTINNLLSSYFTSKRQTICNGATQSYASLPAFSLMN